MRTLTTTTLTIMVVKARRPQRWRAIASAAGTEIATAIAEEIPASTRLFQKAVMNSG